jgi:2-polyprenyl-6-methoxyphenol hydroxylase-like FAD-dependent oxidoreductase
MASHSVAIAGAGPAGLATALLLRRAGHQVTIFERFVTPHAVGSGLMLQPTGLAVLSELGLAAEVMSLGQRIDRLFGRVAPSTRIILDVRYRELGPEAFGVAVHRAALFDPLFEAVKRDGIPIETACSVSGLVRDANGRPSLVAKDSQTFGSFDLVVDAMGVRSPLVSSGERRELSYGALWTTLPWVTAGPFDDHALEQRYRKASVMVGVLPIGRRPGSPTAETAFFWSIKPANYDAWRAAGLDAWKKDVRALWPETAPLLDAIVDPDQMTLARYSHHTLSRPCGERLAIVGDSAHAASPQLGQGANMALLDARALALALRDYDDVTVALRHYAALRRWHVHFYQILSAIFTPFYQSDSTLLPLLRDWLVAPSTRVPLARKFVAGLVAGVVLDPRGRLELRNTL